MLRSVDDWAGEHFAFEGAPAAQQPTSVAIANGVDGPTATIPDAHLLFTAQFSRAGEDLLLRGEDGAAFVVQDYFASDDRARLLSPEGAALSPAVIAALAGPQAPGQYAQAGTAAPAAQAVGRVAQADGDATIVRNGVAMAATAGDPILKGDVLQTVSGKLGVTFNDGSTLNLTANTRLVVNEFVYDPRGSANSQLLDLVQGSLTFISGEIAHNGDMKIGTPVATMGIRGTVGGVTTANDGTVRFYVSQSATGAVILDGSGRIIASVVQDGPLIVVRPAGPLQVLAEEVQKSPAQLALELAELQQVLSTKSVGDQLIQQFFQPNPNPNPNPQSTDKPLTQFQTYQIDLKTNAPGDDGNDDATAPPTTATVTIINPPTSDAPPVEHDPIVVTLATDLAPINFGPLNAATEEDQALTFAGSTAISVFDADTATLTVTLDATHGVLSLSGLAGLTFSAGDGADDATMTFSGTQAAINAALEGMAFKPEAEYSGSASVKVTTTDGANTTSETVAISVNAVDDAPEVMLTGGESVTVDEDSTLVFGTGDGPSIAVSDIDSPTLTVTLTATNGTLNLNLDSDPAIDITGGGQGQATITFTGSPTAVNAALEGMSFAPDANYHGAASVVVTTTDGTNTTSETVAISVNAVDDAPEVVLAGGGEDGVTVDEDSALVFGAGNGPSIAVSDIDSATLTVTLDATHGVLSLSGVAGLAFSAGDGASNATMTFSGTPAAINAALEGMSFAPAANYHGAASVEVTTSDGVNTTSETVAISVNAVDDAPEVAVTGNGEDGVTIEANSELVFGAGNGPSIAVSDIDSTTLTVTLTATHGTLNLNLDSDPAIDVTGGGQGQAAITFTGTPAAINAALEGMSFAPAANYHGAASVEVTTSDGSSTTAPEVISIAVNEIVDEGNPPVIFNVTQHVSYTEDDDSILLSPDLTVTDTDTANLSAALVRISSGYVDGDELTADTDGTNIVADYDYNGTLRLSGVDTVAHYQQVLESVRFSSYSDDPTDGDLSTTRTIDWQVGSSFASQSKIDAGSNVYSMTTGDVNGDGRTDLVVSNIWDQSVSVLLGSGDGTFQERTSFAAGGYAFPATIADVNDDGHADIVVTNFYNGTFSVLLGEGDGTFQAPLTQSTGANPIAVASADLDGDGNADIAVANYNQDSISVLFGNGDGTFRDQVDYATGYSPQSITIADFDADGELDLVTANRNQSSVSVLLGNGDGTFRDKVDAQTGAGPSSLLVADLNSDGKLDLVTANSYDSTVSVLFGIGDGTFSDPTTYATGMNPAAVALGDVNGDGNQDLVTASQDGGSASVLLGNGDGTFRAQSDTDAVGYGAVAAVLIDLNGDGRPDLVTANGWEDSVSVLLGNGTNLSEVQQSTIDVTAVNDAPVNVLPDTLGTPDLIVLGGFTLDQYLARAPTPWETEWADYQAGVLDWMQDYIAGHAADYTAQANVIDYSNDSTPWGSFPGFSYWPSNLDEGGQFDQFFALFTGKIYVSDADTYDFRYDADDGAVLLIDGELYSDSIELAAGVHSVDFYFYDWGGGAIVEFSAARSGGQYSLVGSPGAVTSGADFAIGGLAMYDEDAGDTQMQTTLSVAHGTLTVSPINGATVTGSGTNTVVITGDQWQVDDTLREAGNLVYKSVSNFHGTDTLTMSTTDFGSTGAGGAQTTVSTMEIAVNLPPVLSLTGGHVEDQFNLQAYNLNTGNVHWSGNWTEINDGANNAATGEIRVNNDPAVTDGNFRLALTDLDSESGADDVVQRAADLTGLSNAILTFDYRRAIPNGDAGDIATVYVSADGTNFTALGTIGATGNGSFVDADYQRVSFDISSYISANTTVRFAIGDDADNGDVIYVDNVRITPMMYVQNGDPLPISSPANRISDGDDSQLLYANVKISNAHAGDLLSVIGSLPAGIAATAYNAVSGSLVLYGLASHAAYQTALSQVAFSNSSDYPGNADRIIEVTVNDGKSNSNVSAVTITVIDTDDPPVASNDNLDSANAGLAGFTVNPDNGHWYKIDTSSLSWADAQAAAIAAGGYLATITSAGENTFIDNLRQSAGGPMAWIGASDAGTEGHWVWVDGPESGEQFWQGIDTDNGGLALGYANWNGGEPNDSGSSEDAAHMQDGGVWNDMNAGNQLASVIEASFFVEDRTSIISAASLLANDRDEGVLTINSVDDQDTHGTVTLLENGDIEYVPDADFHGADSFTYTAIDAGGLVSNPATVSFSVAAVDDPVISWTVPVTPLSIAFDIVDTDGGVVEVVWGDETSDAGGTRFSHAFGEGFEGNLTISIDSNSFAQYHVIAMQPLEQGGSNGYVAGTAGNDILIGHTEAPQNTFDGNAGDDVMFATASIDTFIFETGGGKDIVVGFNADGQSAAQDVVDVSDFGIFNFDVDAMNAFLASAVDTTQGLQFVQGNDSLLLLGVHAITVDHLQGIVGS